MKRTKKKIKIKWDNVALLLIMLVCGGVVIHDVFMITIYSWITSYMVGWTWYGLITFLLALFIGGEILEYFIEKIKK